jgi:hypothetical protein
MSAKKYFLFSGLIFTVVAILQALRVYEHWSAVIDRWSIPMWLSVGAVIVAGVMAINAFKLHTKSN